MRSHTHLSFRQQFNNAAAEKKNSFAGAASFVGVLFIICEKTNFGGFSAALNNNGAIWRRAQLRRI
jgi:hypothetical protein